MLLKEGTKTKQEFLHEFSPFFLHFQAFHSISQIKYIALIISNNTTGFLTEKSILTAVFSYRFVINNFYSVLATLK